MIEPAKTNNAIERLLQELGGGDNLDEAFCHALASAIDAQGIALFARDATGDRFTCRYAPGVDRKDVARRSYAPGEGLCGAAALTGDPASNFEPDPPSASRRSGGGILRFAVPIMVRGECRCVIEILKEASAAHIPKKDLFLIQTFGMVFALQSSHDEKAGGTPALPGPQLSQGSDATKALGKSSAFTRSNLLVIKAARSDCPVLILGETGTGKELVARQLHDASKRRSKPYIAINCAALSDTLLESELFGHARGAFTSAIRSRKGRLEEANGGTVFLDEVAEMRPLCQAKLLRTLDSGEITPVGSNKTVRIDVRFIAATNKSLETMMQQGTFREDLYYRLQGMHIELPPLRKRRGDTELLANYFLDQEAKLQGSLVRGFSPEAMTALQAHDWPGNIRELKRVIARAVTLADGERIEIGDLPDELRDADFGLRNGDGFIPQSAIRNPQFPDERARILGALQTTAYPGTRRWNRRAAARLLGMNHHTLGYKIDKVYKLQDGS